MQLHHFAILKIVIVITYYHLICNEKHKKIGEADCGCAGRQNYFYRSSRKKLSATV